MRRQNGEQYLEKKLDKAEQFKTMAKETEILFPSRPWEEKEREEG